MCIRDRSWVALRFDGSRFSEDEEATRGAADPSSAAEDAKRSVMGRYKAAFVDARSLVDEVKRETAATVGKDQRKASAARLRDSLLGSGAVRAFAAVAALERDDWVRYKNTLTEGLSASWVKRLGALVAPKEREIKAEIAAETAGGRAGKGTGSAGGAAVASGTITGGFDDRV